MDDKSGFEVSLKQFDDIRLRLLLIFQRKRKRRDFFNFVLTFISMLIHEKHILIDEEFFDLEMCYIIPDQKIEDVKPFIAANKHNQNPKSKR